MSLIDQIKRKKLYKASSEYVLKNVIDDFIDGKKSETNLKRGLTIFLLVQVRESDLEQVRNIVSKAISNIVDNNGVIQSIMSSIILATFGFPFEGLNNAFAECEKTGHQLLEIYQNDIRVLYGNSEAIFYELTANQYFNYTTLIPKFNAILDTLFSLEYGTIRRLDGT